VEWQTTLLLQTLELFVPAVTFAAGIFCREQPREIGRQELPSALQISTDSHPGSDRATFSPRFASVPHNEIKLLAKRKRAPYSEDMSPNVLIRDVPSGVHSVLVGRAKAQGQSLQEYLVGLLGELAQRPTMPEIMKQIEERVAQDSSATMSSDDIVAIIREGRDGLDAKPS